MAIFFNGCLSVLFLFVLLYCLVLYQEIEVMLKPHPPLVLLLTAPRWFSSVAVLLCLRVLGFICGVFLVVHWSLAFLLLVPREGCAS